MHHSVNALRTDHVDIGSSPASDDLLGSAPDFIDNKNDYGSYEHLSRRECSPYSSQILTCISDVPSTKPSVASGQYQPTSASHIPPGEPMLDDIKVQYHQALGRPTKVYRFEDYKQEERKVNPESLKDRLWHPFSSRLEFEFAELLHDAYMSKSHISRLFDILERIKSRKEEFGLKGSDDVDNAWEKAKLHHPTVSA
jgi:hypothetical protein